MFLPSVESDPLAIAVGTNELATVGDGPADGVTRGNAQLQMREVRSVVCSWNDDPINGADGVGRSGDLTKSEQSLIA